MTKTTNPDDSYIFGGSSSSVGGERRVNSQAAALVKANADDE